MIKRIKSPKLIYKQRKIRMNNRCIEPTCNKLLGGRDAKRCRKCAKQGELHSQWIKREKRMCECKCGGSKIVRINSKWRFLHGHYNKVYPSMKNKHHSKKTKNKIRKSRLGNSTITSQGRKKIGLISKRNWKQKEYREKILANRFKTYRTEDYKQKQSNITKLLWKNEDYRNKTCKAIMKGLQLNPNVPEKKLRDLLNKLFPHEYKFVGNGKVILGGFNPDFINVNGQKKIIEMFGDYWHSRKDIKKRDERRLKTYKQLGYSTLVVWENELKNVDKVKKRVKIFQNG